MTDNQTKTPDSMTEHQAETPDSMTGNVRFRKTLFGKLVLQVEMEGVGYVPEWGGYYPHKWWMDAKSHHAELISERALKIALAKV